MKDLEKFDYVGILRILINLNDKKNSTVPAYQHEGGSLFLFSSGLEGKNADVGRQMVILGNT